MAVRIACGPSAVKARLTFAADGAQGLACIC